jgi:periplasmic divalent cation tolerance protein
MRRLAQVSENDKPILVYTTAPSLEVAEQLGTILRDRRLVACIDVLPGMISHNVR